MAIRKYESSADDKKADKAGEKRTGMSPREWEKSAADKKADAAGQRKLDEKGKKR